MILRMNKKNIVFIGAGNIVTGYNHNMKNCHLRSILDNDSYNILGVIDTDDLNADFFTRNSNSIRLNYSDLENLEVDIIAICTQTPYHSEIISNIIKSGAMPKCIFSEKPFTESLDSAINSFNSLKKLGIGLIIGYQRSFLSNFIQLSKQFHNNEFGKLLYADIKYSKGLLNNGSHAIDLLHSIFGNIELDRFGKKFKDYDSGDKSVEVFFNYKNRSISLIPLDEESFSIFEIDIIFQEKRYRFIDNSFSVEEYTMTDDPRYPDYKSLMPSNYNETNMTHSIDEMWNQILIMMNSESYFDIDRATSVHKLRVMLEGKL